MKNIAINGFGRIGRLVYRALCDDPELNVVAINDLTDAKTLAHLLKYDSTHKKFKHEIFCGEDYLLANNKKIKIFAERDPEILPWGDLSIDYVIESTGIFTSKDKASKHLKAGAKKVIISAPAKGEVDATVVMGVNEHILNKDHLIISNASCTTNCLAPIAKILSDNFGIVSGSMTTIHSYTNDQRILDLPHSDLRRARSAAINLVPTSTGAAKATGLVLPELKGKFDGISVRTPTANGSLVDLCVVFEKEATASQINEAVKKASANEMKGIVEYSEEPLVLTDIVGNPHSAIFDSLLTMVTGKIAKVIAWYDNEWGYSVRIYDLIKHIATLEQ